jgi:hypothetical protein
VAASRKGTTLGPHARLVLADFEDDGDDDEPPEPDPADLRWLAVEYAAAALAADGPHEAFLVLRERDGLEAPVTSGHPDEAALRDGLAELIAAGGPQIPTYQLKITLTRVRPPVWRRVRVPATATLDELHRVIQIAFDWDDDHLHVFAVSTASWSSGSSRLASRRCPRRASAGRATRRRKTGFPAAAETPHRSISRRSISSCPELHRGERLPESQAGTVLIVRATKKLSQRLGSAVPHIGEPSTTLLGDWYATSLAWRPQQLILLVNQQTLLPVLMPLAPAVTAPSPNRPRDRRQAGRSPNT